MKGKLARGVVWMGSSGVLINLIGLASTLLLARLLMPKDFGLVAIAGTFIAILSSLTALPLSTALIQHRDPSEAHYDTAFTLNVARSLVLGALMAAIAWPVAWFYADPRLAPVMLVIAATTSLVGFANPHMATLTRKLEFWQDFVMGVSGKLVGFVVAVALAYAYRSYWALVISSAVVQVLQVGMTYLFVRYRPRISLSAWRDLMGFSVWLTASRLVNSLNFNVDILLVGYFVGQAQLGLYNYGDKLAGLVTRETTSPIAGTLFPAFSRMSSDPARLRRAYLRSQSVLFAIALPTGCGFALIAKPVVILALGAKWIDAIPVIQVVAAASGVASIAMTSWSVAAALGETRMIFRRDLLNFVVRVPLFVIGLTLGGLPGALMARIGSGGFGLILNMGVIKASVGVGYREQVTANLRPLIAVSAMALALLLWQADVPIPGSQTAQAINLALLCALGASVYALTLCLSWVAAGRPNGNEQEVFNVIQGLRRRTAA